MIYQITYFNNYYDTNVATFETYQWHELVSIFSEHTIQSDKDGMMFNFCVFKDTEGTRCSENVQEYHGLILDYDGNGATISEAINRFHPITHYGYTSYNHIVKGVEKFRVLIPFASPCSWKDWEDRKEDFLSLAGSSVDRSCVSHSRSFYLPSCSAANEQYADRWHNVADLFDWRWIQPQPKPLPAPITKPLSTSDLQKALDELKKHRPILPNEDRYWLVRAVAKHVGEKDAIIECRSRWPDSQYNGKYEQQVKKLKADGPGMGSIIHEIRKFNPNFNIHKHDYRTSTNELYAKYCNKPIGETQ